MIGNSIKATNVSDVILIMTASNVVPSTRPPIVNRSNLQLPHHAHQLSLPLPTPVKVDKLNYYLDGYPLRSKQYLIDGFKKGFTLDYVGLRVLSTCNNLLSATQNSTAVNDKLSKE